LALCLRRGVEMIGSSGNDTLNGLTGSETLTGGAGNDSISGGAGNDVIHGDSVAEAPAPGTLTNGTFSDGLAGWTVPFGPSPGVRAITPTNPAIAFNAFNAPAAGTIQQSVATTVGAAYTFSYTIGETGTGAGTHTFRVDILDSQGNVIATRTDTVANDSTQNIILNYTATDSNMTIRVTNTATSNTVSSDGYIDNLVNTAAEIAPNQSADTLSGGVGNDTVYGGVGTDTIAGDDGNDVLFGGAGSDSMLGGGGDDRFVFSGIDNNAGPDTSTPYSPGTITPSVVNTGVAGNQSPPKMIVLADGRVMYVWADNATADNVATMDLQLRIFNADGTPATDQISLGSWPAISGADGFDWDNLDLDRLPSGDIVISYARNQAETGGVEPIFSIIRPGPSGITTILSPIETQSNDVTGIESPPVTTVLPNGNILFIWSRNGTLDDSPTMTLQGRIYNPTTGTWNGPEFQVGNVAVDGSDSDVPSLTVTTLTGGNVVVGWWRNNAETGFAEPVFTVLDQNGATVMATSEIEGTDNEAQSTVWESAPIIQALPNGNFVALWVNDGFSNGVTSMTLEARLFDPNGNALSGDIRIGTSAVDGADGYNLSNVTTDVMPDGRLIIGYVETSATGGSAMPFFSILDTTTGQLIASDVSIAVAPSSQLAGPPLIEVLGDSGYFVAVYANGNGQNGSATGLNFRVFDRNGNAVSGEFPITSAAGGSALSGTGTFDWSSVSVVYNAANQSFTVGWVGTNDGSGTGVFTSGPINVSYFTSPAVLTRDEIVIGGETSETVGDVLDLTPFAGSVTVVFSGSEAGTVTANSGGQRITFSQIERLELGAGDDLVTGGVGDESVDGGAGNDTLDGGDGNDVLQGGAGADSLTGGAGNDVLTGDAAGDLVGANDSLFGGDGNDTLSGNAGADSLFGGDGDDYLYAGSFNQMAGDLFDGGAGNDTVDYSAAGGGVNVNLGTGIGTDSNSATHTLNSIEAVIGSMFADTLLGGGGAESLSGNGGDDVLEGRGGADTLDGGIGNDVLSGDEASDTVGSADVLSGGAGNDTMTGNAGADTLYGGADNDSLDGGAGADLLDGGAGTDRVDYTQSDAAVQVDLSTGQGAGGHAQGDTLASIEEVVGSGFDDSLTGSGGADNLSGGAGGDTLRGGLGDDTLIGGAGDDRYILQDGGGADRITDFDLTRQGRFANDRLDVSGMTDAQGGPVYWSDVVVTDTVGDGSGDAVLTFPNGQTVILQGVSPAQVTGRANMQAIGIPCFASGTPIRVPGGWKNVEDLVPGDRVVTRGGAVEPVIWSGSRLLRAGEIEARPSLRPVKIRPGALGNRGEVRLSPQHAVLMLLDGEEVLVRAVHLAKHGYRGCRIAEGTRRIGYHHILLPDHAVLDADGLAAESLYPGRNAMTPLDRKAQTEVAAAVLALRRTGREEVIGLADLARLYGPTVRPVLSGADVERAIAREALVPVAMDTALVAATAVTKVPTGHKRPELRLVKAAA
jgi:Ca2+-binding RTX toxin-like protein